MGGSASYRLARKIAKARDNGASESEIAELERQRQTAMENERAKRQAKNAEDKVLASASGNIPTGSNVSASEYARQEQNTSSAPELNDNGYTVVTSKFESLDEERGLRFPKINTERQMSARPSYPVTERQLSYRETLSNSQRATLDAMERRLQTGRYTQNEFRDEIVDIAKSLGMNTTRMSAWTLSVGINDLLGSRL